MKKYFVLLLFILSGCATLPFKAKYSVKKVIPVKKVIQDKSSLQNFAYYFVFTSLFVAFTVWISRKSKWPYFKYFVAYNAAVLLFSAAYHTAVYWKKDCYKHAFDHESFYFRQKFRQKFCGKRCNGLNRMSFQELLNKEENAIKSYKYNNLHYYIFYRFIRDVLFSQKNFFAAFFFASLLNACLWIIGLFLFVEILLALKCKPGYMLSICVLLSSPDFLARNEIPLANVASSFALILFLWFLVKRKNAILIFLCGYGFYFAHKIYYLLPFVLLVAFLVWHLRQKRSLLLGSILAVLLGGGLVLTSDNLPIKNTLVFNSKRRMSISRGDSQIPQINYKVLKLCNSWFAPLVCNFNKLLVKPKEASKLGFLAAVFFNIVCITCVVLLIYHLIQGKWKHFPEEDKKVIFISLAIIAYLTVAFMSVSNYLNLLRHKQCVMSVWYILLAYFYRENTNNNKELESQNA